MAQNLLEQTVGNLQRLHQELQKGREVEANAQRYRELQKELNPLLDAWQQVAQRRSITEAVGADIPDQFANLRTELREVLRDDFAAFAEAYLSKEGLQAFRLIAQNLIRQLAALEGSLKKAVDDQRKAVLRDADDLLSRVRIRKQCGLLADESSVERLRDEFQKFFANIAILTPDSRAHRWANLSAGLRQAQREHSLDGTGLSGKTLAFLERLMSDAKDGPTLADLTPDMLTELKRFPSLTAGVRLVRKGVS